MRKQSSLFGGDIEKIKKKAISEKAVVEKQELASAKPVIVYEVGTDSTPKPLSVSAFIALINSALKNLECQITGEITKASFPPSAEG